MDKPYVPAKETSTAEQLQEEKTALEESFSASQLQDIVTEHKQLLTDARAYLTQLQSKREATCR